MAASLIAVACVNSHGWSHLMSIYRWTIFKKLTLSQSMGLFRRPCSFFVTCRQRLRSGPINFNSFFGVVELNFWQIEKERCDWRDTFFCNFPVTSFFEKWLLNLFLSYNHVIIGSSNAMLSRKRTSLFEMPCVQSKLV